jgi:hypothetical protein
VPEPDARAAPEVEAGPKYVPDNPHLARPSTTQFMHTIGRTKSESGTIKPVLGSTIQGVLSLVDEIQGRIF